jgi:trk system potassium uptake protein TrkA
MKVVVLGAGHVGYEIAKQLSFEEHDVSIVDNNATTLKKVSDRLDVKPVFGKATDLDVLNEAGVEDANIVIAVTSSDESNIVACQISSFMFGVEAKIARISDQSYFRHISLFGKNRFAIDMIVSPEVEIASTIKRSVSVHGALDVIPCLDDKIRIIGVQCTKKSVFANIQIRFVSNVSNGLHIAILLIERENQVFIPGKNDVILAGDNIYFAVSHDEMETALSLFNDVNEERKGLLLIGGGVIAEEVSRSMLLDSPETTIRIIEDDFQRVEKLSEELNNVEILYGDTMDPEIMNAPLVSNATAIVAVTNSDKTNILSCLLAKGYGAKRVIAMISYTSNMQLCRTLGINTVMDSRKAVVSKILHYIRNGEEDNIFTFADDSIEILTISVSSNSRAIGILIDDIGSVEKIIATTLIRADKIFMFPKRMVINAGDKILFVAEKKSSFKIALLFKEKPRYLV